MAHPIAPHLAHHDPRERLRVRVDQAPAGHAEAILAAYEVLQLLHDRGVLELTRSALMAGEELLGMAADQLDAPASIRTIRHLVFLSAVLGRVPPECVEALAGAIPDAVAKAATRRRRPAGRAAILRRLFSRDSMRGLEACADVLESVGRHLRALDAG